MIDVIIFFVVYYVSLFSLFALFYYLTPYKTQKLNERFKEIKQPPITRADIEKILKLFNERSSQPNRFVSTINEKKYWLFLMFFSLVLVLFMLLLPSHFIMFNLFLLYLFAIEKIIIQRFKLLSGIKEVFSIFIIYFLFSFIMLFLTVIAFAAIFSISDVTVWIGITYENWYLTMAGIAFSFSISLWFVTTLYSLLKQEHKMTKILLDKIKQSILDDKTNDLEKYYKNNEELLKKTYSSYEDSKTIGRYIRMLSYTQFLLLIFGISFIVFDLMTYHFTNKVAPDSAFLIDQIVLAWFFLCVVFVGLTIISLVKHIMIKLPEMEDEEI